MEASENNPLPSSDSFYLGLRDVLRQCDDAQYNMIPKIYAQVGLMKPKMTCFLGRWHCHSLDRYGYGETPEKAYSAWLQHLSPRQMSERRHIAGYEAHEKSLPPYV